MGADPLGFLLQPDDRSVQGQDGRGLLAVPAVSLSPGPSGPVDLLDQNQKGHLRLPQSDVSLPLVECLRPSFAPART
jgi:hypothetical protein